MNSREASPSPPLGPHTNVVVSPGLNSTTPSRSLPIRSFGSGKVLQDRDLAAGATGGLADAARGFRVLVGAAVGEVQTCDIHAGLDHAGEDFRVARGGANRGDDLRAALHLRGTIERHCPDEVLRKRVRPRQGTGAAVR